MTESALSEADWEKAAIDVCTAIVGRAPSSGPQISAAVQMAKVLDAALRRRGLCIAPTGRTATDD